MQCNGDVPARISLYNRTACVWVDTLTDRIAVRDVSSSIAGRLSIHVTRDSLVSVLYSVGLNSARSSSTHQRTDRHGILGQKPADFQRNS